MLDALRAAADYGRQAADGLGIRLVTVTIVTATYSAAHNTAGATLVGTPVSLVLSPRFKVTEDADGGFSAFGGGGLSESIGVLRANRYRVGPITKAYSGGGYSELQLLPQPTSPSQRIYYTLDDGGETFNSNEKFAAFGVLSSRPLQLTLVLQRTDQT